MSRRNRAVKREIVPDIRYSNVTVQGFISRMMRGGKRSVAQRVMYDTLGSDRTARQAQPDGCV